MNDDSKCIVTLILTAGAVMISLIANNYFGGVAENKKTFAALEHGYCQSTVPGSLYLAWVKCEAAREAGK